MRNWKLFSYFLTKTYAVGAQKNRLIEHLKHMFKFRDKEMITIYAEKFCVTGPMYM